MKPRQPEERVVPRPQRKSAPRQFHPRQRIEEYHHDDHHGSDHRRVLIVGLTYVLTSEGLWGAALMFFNVLFGAMIAFNFYEPLAKLIDSTGITWGFSDTLCMLGLFCVSVLLLRMTTETIAPAMVRFPDAGLSSRPSCFRSRGGARHHRDS